eukprot:8130176-Alexandrium_andersonii.AAC.1
MLHLCSPALPADRTLASSSSEVPSSSLAPLPSEAELPSTLAGRGSTSANASVDSSAPALHQRCVPAP